MDVDKNKAVVRLFFEEAWNKGNSTAADDYIAANCLSKSGAPAGPLVKRAITNWHAAFPDFAFHVLLLWRRTIMSSPGRDLPVRIVGCSTTLQQGTGPGDHGSRPARQLTSRRCTCSASRVARSLKLALCGEALNSSSSSA